VVTLNFNTLQNHLLINQINDKTCQNRQFQSNLVYCRWGIWRGL